MKNFKRAFLLFLLTAFCLQTNLQAQGFSQQEKEILALACKLSTSPGSTAVEKKFAQSLDPAISAKVCAILQEGRAGNEDIIKFVLKAYSDAKNSSSNTDNTTPDENGKDNNGSGSNPKPIPLEDRLNYYEQEVLGLACKLSSKGADPKKWFEVKFAQQLTPETARKACTILSGDNRKGNETMINRIISIYENIKPDPSPRPKFIQVYHTDTYPMLKQPEKMALDAACKICEKAAKSEASLSTYEKSFLDLFMEPTGNLPGMALCEFGGEKNYACFVFNVTSENGKAGYEDFISKVVTVQNHLKK